MKTTGRIVSALLCAALLFSFAGVFVVGAQSVSLPLAAKRTVVKRYLGEALGISQAKVVRWLSSHEKDGYYIGTPYTDYPVGSPNGDPNFILNGKYSSVADRPAMNCAGFVSHVLRKCGVDLRAWRSYMEKEFPDRWNAQEYDAGSANMWYLYVTGDENGLELVDPETGKSDVEPGENGSDVFVCYAFNSTGEALRSGLLRKGDICIYWPTEGYDHAYDGVIDSHIGFFWGNDPQSNKFWHSAGTGTKTNRITNMHSMTRGEYVLYVVPISPREQIDEQAARSFWNSRGTLGLAGLALGDLGLAEDAAALPGYFEPTVKVKIDG